MTTASSLPSTSDVSVDDKTNSIYLYTRLYNTKDITSVSNSVSHIVYHAIDEARPYPCGSVPIDKQWLDDVCKNLDDVANISSWLYTWCEMSKYAAVGLASAITLTADTVTPPEQQSELQHYYTYARNVLNSHYTDVAQSLEDAARCDARGVIRHIMYNNAKHSRDSIYAAFASACSFGHVAFAGEMLIKYAPEELSNLTRIGFCWCMRAGIVNDVERAFKCHNKLFVRHQGDVSVVPAKYGHMDDADRAIELLLTNAVLTSFNYETFYSLINDLLAYACDVGNAELVHWLCQRAYIQYWNEDDMWKNCYGYHGVVSSALVKLGMMRAAFRGCKTVFAELNRLITDRDSLWISNMSDVFTYRDVLTRNTGPNDHTACSVLGLDELQLLQMILRNVDTQSMENYPPVCWACLLLCAYTNNLSMFKYVLNLVETSVVQDHINHVVHAVDALCTQKTYFIVALKDTFGAEVVNVASSPAPPGDPQKWLAESMTFVFPSIALDERLNTVELAYERCDENHINMPSLSGDIVKYLLLLRACVAGNEVFAKKLLLQKSCVRVTNNLALSAACSSGSNALITTLIASNPRIISELIDSRDLLVKTSTNMCSPNSATTSTEALVAALDLKPDQLYEVSRALNDYIHDYLRSADGDINRAVVAHETISRVTLNSQKTHTLRTPIASLKYAAYDIIDRVPDDSVMISNIDKMLSSQTQPPIRCQLLRAMKYCWSQIAAGSPVIPMLQTQLAAQTANLPTGDNECSATMSVNELVRACICIDNKLVTNCQELHRRYPTMMSAVKTVQIKCRQQQKRLHELSKITPEEAACLHVTSEKTEGLTTDQYARSILLCPICYRIVAMFHDEDANDGAYIDIDPMELLISMNETQREPPSQVIPTMVDCSSFYERILMSDTEILMEDSDDEETTLSKDRAADTGSTSKRTWASIFSSICYLNDDRRVLHIIKEHHVSPFHSTTTKKSCTLANYCEAWLTKTQGRPVTPFEVETYWRKHKEFIETVHSSLVKDESNPNVSDRFKFLIGEHWATVSSIQWPMLSKQRLDKFSMDPSTLLPTPEEVLELAKYNYIH